MEDIKNQEEFMKLVIRELAMRDMKISDFVRSIGTTRITFYNWKKGRNRMALSNYFKIIKFLDLKDKNSGLNIGWVCPVCGRGNAPTTGTCQCQPIKYTVTY